MGIPRITTVIEKSLLDKWSDTWYHTINERESTLKEIQKGTVWKHDNNEREENNMRKTRVTAKWVRQNFTTIYSASYSAFCDLQSALPDPAYYTCGVYGWNADVFILDKDTVVVAGYRPFGNVKVDTEQLREILSKQGD